MIGTKLGWSYGAEFDEARKAKLFGTTVGPSEKIYRLLNLERIDAVVDNELSGLRLIKRIKYQSNIRVLPTPLLHGEIYIAIKKGANLELIKRFNRHLEKIRQSGVYDEILSKYR